MGDLSMNETTTFRWSLEEDVANYSAAGIPSIGVWRQKLSDCGQARAIELLEQSHLRVSHLCWAGGFTGSEGRSYRESIEDAAEALHAAAVLGAGCLIIYTGTRAGHTANHARRLIRGALGRTGPLAEQLHVDLAVEPMHPGCAAQCTFLTNLDETLALLDAVGHPNVKMVFDTYHLGHDPAVVDRIPALAPRAALVQLGDAHGPPNGEQDRCRSGSRRAAAGSDRPRLSPSRL